MRYLGLILTTLALFLCLLPAHILGNLPDPRRATMTVFYLSILLTLLLSYQFAAAGRAEGLAMSSGGDGQAGRLQQFGFPILHRHAWGDFGRLYALLFLVFMAPVLFALFVTLMASAFAGFEQTVTITEDGTGLSETEALVQIAEGEIALDARDAARASRVGLIGRVGYALGLLVIMPCFARLVPFFFWRSGGRDAAKLSEVWATVPWRHATAFGLSLAAGLAALVFLPVPIWAAYALAALFFGLWALIYARTIGPYPGMERVYD